jgi:hypothetical protein
MYTNSCVLYVKWRTQAQITCCGEWYFVKPIANSEDGGVTYTVLPRFHANRTLFKEPAFNESYGVMKQPRMDTSERNGKKKIMRVLHTGNDHGSYIFWAHLLTVIT